MLSTNARRALICLILYTATCFVAAAMLMVIEYEEAKVQSKQRNIALQVADIINDTLGFAINETTAAVMTEHISKMIEQNKEVQRDKWKGHINTETFLKWRYFVGVATTTVGYGDIYPTTAWGKVFVVAFTLIGIPLCMFTLATMGSLFCELFGTFKNSIKNKLSGENIQRRPTIFCIIQSGTFTLLYVIVCGVGVATIEGWSNFDGIYWAFITFTTIGFGDLAPTSTSKWYSEGLCLLSILGLAFTAMTFDIALQVANNKITSRSALHDGTKQESDVTKSNQFKKQVQTEV